jgi:hypothetical protein
MRVLLVRGALVVLPLAVLTVFGLDIGGVRTAVLDSIGANVADVEHVDASSRQSVAPSVNGLAFRGQFYWLSPATVKPASVGDLLTRRVRYRDTSANLRSIRGVDPARAVAVRVRGQSRDFWTLAASDVHAAADPSASPDWLPVLRP